MVKRLQLESRANSISTETCNQDAACVIDLDRCRSRIGVSGLVHGCFPRDDYPARKDVLSIKREVFEAKRIGTVNGMAPNTFPPVCRAGAVPPLASVKVPPATNATSVGKLLIV